MGGIRRGAHTERGKEREGMRTLGIDREEGSRRQVGHDEEFGNGEVCEDLQKKMENGKKERGE